MKHASTVLAISVFAILLTLPIGLGSQGVANPNRQLLIVLDGLRPDYVTPATMPTLHGLAARGVVFERHHAVYPTVTRVNASSIATGAYPDVHGLMGNTVFFPKVDPRRFLDTEDRSNLLAIENTGDSLLTTSTIGEALQAVGRKLLVVSAGSTGASYLLNRKVSGGAIIQTEYTLPSSLHSRVVAQLGQPGRQMSPAEKNRRAADAFLKVGLPDISPDVTVLWFTDPDSTAHRAGIGHPATVESLKHLDGEINRVLDGLTRAGLSGRFDVWVTSDHGFSTYTGSPDLKTVLQPFEGTLADGTPRIVRSEGAIYVRDHDRGAITGIVQALQRTSGIGAIFTRASTTDATSGQIPGTLSFDIIHWAHDRSGDILFSPEWTESANAYGFKGTTASNGVAGHGSASPFDIHNALIAVGPDLRSGVRLAAPSGNVDFAPTFLRLLGLPIPDSMQGRVLDEAFRSYTGPERSYLEGGVVSGAGASRYTISVRTSTVVVDGRSYRYLDAASVTRER